MGRVPARAGGVRRVRLHQPGAAVQVAALHRFNGHAVGRGAVLLDHAPCLRLVLNVIHINLAFVHGFFRVGFVDLHLDFFGFFF